MHSRSTLRGHYFESTPFIVKYKRDVRQLYIYKMYETEICIVSSKISNVIIKNTKKISILRNSFTI